MALEQFISNEAVLVSRVDQYLHSRGWTTRVETGDRTHRIDIIATLSDCTLIIECKVNIGGPIDAQAAITQVSGYLSRHPGAMALIVASHIGRGARRIFDAWSEGVACEWPRIMPRVQNAMEYIETVTSSHCFPPLPAEVGGRDSATSSHLFPTPPLRGGGWEEVAERSGGRR